MIVPIAENNANGQDWDEAFAKYNGRLYGMARMWFGHHDALDAVQDVWLQAWRFRGKWRDGCDAWHCLCRLLRWTAWKLIDRRPPKTLMLLGHEKVTTVTPDRIAEAKDEWGRVLQKVFEGDRPYFELHALGLTRKEIVARLGVSKNTVAKRVQRARKCLYTR